MMGPPLNVGDEKEDEGCSAVDAAHTGGKKGVWCDVTWTGSGRSRGWWPGVPRENKKKRERADRRDGTASREQNKLGGRG